MAGYDPIAAARDALGYDHVHWFPLKEMPLVAELIDGMVIDGAARIQLFAEALKREAMDAFDDVTIENALRLHHERVHFVAIWCEQLRRWRAENPDPEQCREIDRLEKQVNYLSEINRQIFRLVQPREDDIEAIVPPTAH
jgi:hypothetical protein